MDGEKYAVTNGVKINVSTELEGKVKVSVRPEDIILSTGPLVSSARNVIKGTVTDIIPDGESVRKVMLDVGIPMLVLITDRSMRDMKIKKGSEPPTRSLKQWQVRVIK